MLSPESDMHGRGDIGEFKTVAEEVLNLFRLKLPIELPQKVKAKLEVVDLGLIQEPTALQPVSNLKEKKPSLNTEDLFEYLTTTA